MNSAAEGSPSGLWRRLGKAVWEQSHRGFESLSLRQPRTPQKNFGGTAQRSVLAGNSLPLAFLTRLLTTFALIAIEFPFPPASFTPITCPFSLNTGPPE